MGSKSVSDSSDDALCEVGKKTAKGAIWLSLAQVLSRVLGSLRIIALAAIVPLPELGLFGIAVIVMQFIERLSETGINRALIQKHGNIDGYLGTAWFTQIVRGLMLSCVVYCSAGLVEAFFEKQGVAQLLRLLAILPVLQGMQNVGVLHLHRELSFSKVVILQLSVSLTDLLSTLVLACYWPFASSLVVGRLIGIFVGVVLSFLLESRRPNIHFSRVQFAELYKFGFWIFVSALLSFTLIRGGDLVVGKLFTDTDLAIYQIAYGIACTPIMEVMAVVSTATFSAYSRIQNDAARLAAAFLRVLSLSSFVAAFSIVGFVTLSVDFTKLCFKPECAPIAQMLPWLAVWGACRALGSTNSVLFQSIGRPALATVFQFLMLFLFAILLIPMARQYGMMGVVTTLVLVGLLAQLSRYMLVIRVLEVTLSEVAIRILVPVGLGILTLVPAFTVLNLIHSDLHLLRIFVGLVSISIFWIGTLVIDSVLDFGVAGFFLSQYPRLRRLVDSLPSYAKSVT